MMRQARSAVRGPGTGQSAGAPNPSQPQLKAVPMIARMEEAKRRLRMPAKPGGGPVGGMMPAVDPNARQPQKVDMNAKGAQLSPNSMDRPVSLDSGESPMSGMAKAIRPMNPGAEIGGAMPPYNAKEGPPQQGFEKPFPQRPGEPFGGPAGGPSFGQLSGSGGEDPYAMLPPRMRKTARAAGRDPQEALASRMANDPNYRQSMIKQFSPGGPGGLPAGNPGDVPDQPFSTPPPPGGMNGMMPAFDPNARVSGNPQIKQGMPPPGGPQSFMPGMEPGMVATDQIRQKLGFNPASLADLFQGRKPPQPGMPPAGGGMEPGFYR